MQSILAARPRRLRVLPLAAALAAGLAVALVVAVTAFAATDHFLNSTYISNGADYAGTTNHYNTLVYGHNLEGNHAWMGAAVTGCYSVAHAYDEVTHSYGTPCNSLPYIENDAGFGFTANGHSDY